MKEIIFSLIITSVLILSGCGMNNDEIIRETKKCEEAGLKTEAVESIGGDIWINCLPNEDK
jgi:hypothetical protein